MYAPEKNADNIPDEAVLKTCVIVIEPAAITGKKAEAKRPRRWQGRHPHCRSLYQACSAPAIISTAEQQKGYTDD
jgi:hypothetical protein